MRRLRLRKTAVHVERIGNGYGRKGSELKRQLRILGADLPAIAFVGQRSGFIGGLRERLSDPPWLKRRGRKPLSHLFRLQGQIRLPQLQSAYRFDGVQLGKRRKYERNGSRRQYGNGCRRQRYLQKNASRTYLYRNVSEYLRVRRANEKFADRHR